mgnify:CR=1 FL=1
MSDMEIIASALAETGKSRIIVLGDYALDKYLYIDPKRDEPSLETGLIAYQIHGKRMSAGAGGNVVSNLRALGAQVTCISLVGDDGVVVAPDSGSTKMAMQYGDMLSAGFAVVTKRRINATTVASSHLVGDVKDRICVITDDLTSTCGTLCAAARILKAHGAAKVYAAVSRCLLNEKGKEKAIAVLCDVTDYKQVCVARDTAVEAFGRIDIVANFAGGYGRRMKKVDNDLDFTEVPIEVFDWSLDLNLKGPFYFAHAVLKQMREKKSGLIINIGSITGAEGDGYGMDYPTSKAGLMYGLTKSIAQFGEAYGIRCVCVSPGPVLTRAAMANMKTPLGRAAEQQEIIDLILFIASEKGQFINGENIMIDGGRNAMKRKC